MIDGEKESRGLRHCVDNSVLEESTEQETRQGSDDKKKEQNYSQEGTKIGEQATGATGGLGHRTHMKRKDRRQSAKNGWI